VRPISALLPSRQLLAAACGAGLLMTSAAQASNDSLGQWRDYARQGMAPAYSWAESDPVPPPTVLSSVRQARATVHAALLSPFAGLSLRASESAAGYAPSDGAASNGLLSRDRSLIRSEFTESTIGHQFGGRAGRLELTAVVAHQRYASAGFGTAPWVAREELVGLRNELPSERSAGHGVRLTYGLPLGDVLSWNVTAQSKLDMDAFESYRGVYSEAGDFDLPARVQTQLQFDLTPALAVALGIERVFYSNVAPFTSSALPSRFLSLLGDGSSPEFAWRDLTVYSAEAAVADGQGGEWGLRYTTRQQPSPTSALLASAMASDYTDTNLALSYRRQLGVLGELWLAAAYAPSRYFLGASPYQQRDLDGGSQVEIEALWSIPF
jgi:hypothetical protein